MSAYLIIFGERNKTEISLTLTALTLLPVFHLVAALWAVDSSTALYGFVKFLPVALFGFAVAPLEKEKKLEIVTVIPYSAAVMGILSYVLSFIPVLSNWFLVASRLGGFFQYPNTFACFCLIGIAISFLKEKITPKDWIVSVVLIGIIFLTGSRTVFVLLVVVSTLIFIKIGKQYRISLVCIIAGAVVASLIIVLLTDSVQTVGRFLTISLESSTLLGRLLYYKDALPVILKNPFGLGYYGYYFSQGSFQTGVYSVAFVHNEFLQMLLDIGWIPTSLFFFIAGKSLFSKKNGTTEKLMLFIILSHSLFDFDLQFICVFFVLILALDFDIVTVMKVSVTREFLACILVSVSLICTYFGAVNAFFLLGKYETVEKIYGKDTQTQIVLMTQEKNYENIKVYAEEILSRNEHVSIAYSACANQAFKNGDIKSFIEYKEKAIGAARYSIDEYNDYCEKLIVAINLYAEARDMTSAQYCMERLVEVEEMLNDLKESTDDLAWKIKDKPNLSLESFSEYIKEFKS